jgi:hypothetical protein
LKIPTIAKHNNKAGVLTMYTLSGVGSVVSASALAASIFIEGACFASKGISHAALVETRLHVNGTMSADAKRSYLYD